VWRRARGEREALARELATPRDRHAGAGYAGSGACASCHPHAYATWRRTFHRTMTADVSPAHPEAVLGDFGGAEYAYGNTTARMTRDPAGRFLMIFASASGSSRTVEIVRAVGSHRYQQYLARDGLGGALWRLPIAYHVEERRWFHMNGAFLTPDPVPVPGGRDRDDGGATDRPVFGGMASGFDRHVTRWNDNCIFCHNVGPDPGWDAATGTFRTKVAELGIGCEACHGPAAEHVRANADPARRAALQASGAPDPTITHPGRLSPARSADVCGRCHGQRMADDVAPFLVHGDPFVPGEDLGLYSAPLWRETPLHGDPRAFAARFWEDGTPRLTAYEYQGLLLSACASRGTLTCTSCHDMHDSPPRGQLRPSAAGDAGCTSCHGSLAAEADKARHSHHLAGGPGARCVACHMPKIVYGVLDLHVSHRIEIPDVARAIAMGRPDACTLCHVERSRGWALAAAARWWPGAAGGRAAEASSAFGPARGHGSAQGPPAAADGEGDAQAPLAALFAGDPIARAVAAEAIGTAPPLVGGARSVRQGALLDAMAEDRYPAVRHLAARALARLCGPAEADARSLAVAFDPTGPASARGRLVASLRALLAPAPARTRARDPRGDDGRDDVAIGE
jgi:predicted CXXCH cytochrome family protein